MAGQTLVKYRASAHHAEIGVVGQLGPGKNEGGDTSTVDPQPLCVFPTRLFGDVDTQPNELLDGARSQAITANFVAGERRLLQQGDMQPPAGEVRSGR